MGFDPITAGLEVAGKIIDRVFPDPTQRDKAKLDMIKMQQDGEFKAMEIEAANALEQIKVNAVEATSTSTFVSGGRPAALWVCVFGMAYTFIFQPLFSWGAVVAGVASPPTIDSAFLIQLLMGMLGLAGIRSYDKAKGTASK